MSKVGKYVSIALLLVISFPLLIMYVWLFMNSISAGTLYGFLPKRVSMESWNFLWKPIPFVGKFSSVWPVVINTCIVAGGVSILNVFISSSAGYALSKLKIKGKGVIMQSTMVLKAFPVLILMIATYFILFKLQLLNTFFAPILSRTAMEAIMGLWIMKGFFDGIPKEIEEASMLDGATRFQTWWKVMLPLVMPGIGAVAILSFLAGWNDFIFVYTYIFDERKWTLSVLLYQILSTPESLDYSFLSALSVFYMIPALILYTLTQKVFMKATIGGALGGT